MMGALVTILSLNTTLSLLNAGVVYKTLPITAATATTPIAVTSPNHGVASGRFIHGAVTGVTGMTEANGMWVLTPIDPDNFSLTTFTAQGVYTPSVGVNVYTGGGTISWSFPDGGILLGRRNVDLSTSVATPRIVFVPTDGRAWGFEPYGGLGAAPGPIPPSDRGQRGTLEQQSERLSPQLETQNTTFEVYVNAAAPDYALGAVSPDFYDFDAVQLTVHALYAAIFDATSQARGRVLREMWPSQRTTSGTMTQRGQRWLGIIEFQQPVIRLTPGMFVPIGTSIQFTVEPINPGSTDTTVFTVT
jgi:hypothetical protein